MLCDQVARLLVLRLDRLWPPSSVPRRMHGFGYVCRVASDGKRIVGHGYFIPALKNPPLGVTPDRVWKAYEAAEPEAVKGKGGAAIVDLIALVRHALDPQEPIIPFARTVEDRYQLWLAEQGQKGVNGFDRGLM